MYLIVTSSKLFFLVAKIKDQNYQKIAALEKALDLSTRAAGSIREPVSGSVTPDRSVDDTFYRAFYYADTPRSSMKEIDVVPPTAVPSATPVDAVLPRGVNVAVQASELSRWPDTDSKDQLDVEEVASAVAKNTDEFIRRRRYVLTSTENRVIEDGLDIGKKKFNALAKSKRTTQLLKAKVKSRNSRAPASSPFASADGDTQVTGKTHCPPAASISLYSAGFSKSVSHITDSKSTSNLESHAHYYDDSLFDLLDEMR